MPPIVAREIEAEQIASGISKVRFTPQPTLVHRARFKLDSRSLKLCNRRIKLLYFEVDDYPECCDCGWLQVK